MGGPAVKMPTHRGFGTRIIEGTIGQLKGEARFDWRTEGIVCEITLQALTMSPNFSLTQSAHSVRQALTGDNRRGLPSEFFRLIRISHQPEAQYPKSSAIHKLAGRLPRLCAQKQT